MVGLTRFLHISLQRRVGKNVLKNILELDPESIGIYGFLANIYVSIGRWENVRKVREMLKYKGLEINLGCSWIEIKE